MLALTASSIRSVSQSVQPQGQLISSGQTWIPVRSFRPLQLRRRRRAEQAAQCAPTARRINFKQTPKDAAVTNSADGQRWLIYNTALCDAQQRAHVDGLWVNETGGGRKRQFLSRCLFAAARPANPWSRRRCGDLVPTSVPAGSRSQSPPM